MRNSSKKGNAIIDSLFIIVILFVCAIAWILSTAIQKEVNDEIQADETISAEGKQVMAETTSTGYKVLDNAILFFLIGFWALAIIASFMIDTHPVFFIISLILLIAIFIVVMYLGNAFDEAMADEELAGMSLLLPWTFFIFNHFLAVFIVVALSILLVMVGKPR